jgi:hypothetical protein
MSEATEAGTADPSATTARTPVGRPRNITASGTMFAPRWASPWWLIFLGLAVAEVVALAVRQQRVPPESDWLAAAQLVRAHLESTDAITVAPAWADPLLRLYLGDRITPKVAGRSDLASFERLWVLSIRGQRTAEAPLRAPDFSEDVGRVHVERYDFGPTPVVLDLVDALPSAHVEVATGSGTLECPWKERVGGAYRGGLGFGPLPPRQRFVCDAGRPSGWVGVTLLEDLSLAPRRCVYQHPQGRAPVSVTYADVHLGSRLVLYAGLDYHQERDEKGAPVTLRVLVDDREIGRVVHKDGEGWKRVELATRSDADPVRGNLRLEVSAPNAQRRAFCWAATVQDTTRREAP